MKASNLMHNMIGKAEAILALLACASVALPACAAPVPGPGEILHRNVTPAMLVTTNAWQSVSSNTTAAINTATNELHKSIAPTIDYTPSNATLVATIKSEAPQPVTDYRDLSNLPKINGITLGGTNNTAQGLGLLATNGGTMTGDINWDNGRTGIRIEGGGLVISDWQDNVWVFYEQGGASQVARLGDIAVKSVQRNGTPLTPDADGAVNVEVPSTNGLASAADVAAATNSLLTSLAPTISNKRDLLDLNVYAEKNSWTGVAQGETYHFSMIESNASYVVWSTSTNMGIGVDLMRQPAQGVWSLRNKEDFSIKNDSETGWNDYTKVLTFTLWEDEEVSWTLTRDEGIEPTGVHLATEQQISDILISALDFGPTGGITTTNEALAAVITTVATDALSPSIDDKRGMYDLSYTPPPSSLSSSKNMSNPSRLLGDPEPAQDRLALVSELTASTNEIFTSIAPSIAAIPEKRDYTNLEYAVVMKTERFVLSEISTFSFDANPISTVSNVTDLLSSGPYTWKSESEDWTLTYVGNGDWRLDGPQRYSSEIHPSDPSVSNLEFRATQTIDGDCVLTVRRVAVYAQAEYSDEQIALVSDIAPVNYQIVSGDDAKDYSRSHFTDGVAVMANGIGDVTSSCSFRNEGDSVILSATIGSNVEYIIATWNTDGKMGSYVGGPAHGSGEDKGYVPTIFRITFDIVDRNGFHIPSDLLPDITIPYVLKDRYITAFIDPPTNLEFCLPPVPTSSGDGDFSRDCYVYFKLSANSKAPVISHSNGSVILNDGKFPEIKEAYEEAAVTLLHYSEVEKNSYTVSSVLSNGDGKGGGGVGGGGGGFSFEDGMIKVGAVSVKNVAYVVNEGGTSVTNDYTGHYRLNVHLPEDASPDLSFSVEKGSGFDDPPTNHVYFPLYYFHNGSVSNDYRGPFTVATEMIPPTSGAFAYEHGKVASSGTIKVGAVTYKNKSYIVNQNRTSVTAGHTGPYLVSVTLPSNAGDAPTFSVRPGNAFNETHGTNVVLFPLYDFKNGEVEHDYRGTFVVDTETQHSAFQIKDGRIGVGAVTVGHTSYMVNSGGFPINSDGPYRVRVTLPEKKGGGQIGFAVEYGSGFNVAAENIVFFPLYDITNGQVSADYRGTFVVDDEFLYAGHNNGAFTFYDGVIKEGAIMIGYDFYKVNDDPLNYFEVGQSFSGDVRVHVHFDDPADPDDQFEIKIEEGDGFAAHSQYDYYFPLYHFNKGKVDKDWRGTFVMPAFEVGESR